MHTFWTPIFIDSFSISAPILAPFWSMFSDLCIFFSSIEFALIFYWFLNDFWDPWSCEKTILTLYSSQKTRNRRFQNVIDLSSILGIVLAWFWEHFLINFHTFSTSTFALIFEHIFNGKWHPNGSQKMLLGPICLHTFGFVFRTSTFGCILVAIWLPFGYLWLPSARFWLHFGRFGSLLEHFWWKMGPKTDREIDEQASFFSSFSRHCLLYWLYVEFRSLLIHCLLRLAHLWLPLAPFWLPLGIFWVLFGAIWFTFAHPMVLFSHFGISQPSVIFYILLYFQRKSYRRQGFSCKLFIARWRERGFAALKINLYTKVQHLYIWSPHTPTTTLPTADAAAGGARAAGINYMFNGRGGV